MKTFEEKIQVGFNMDNKNEKRYYKLKSIAMDYRSRGRDLYSGMGIYNHRVHGSYKVGDDFFMDGRPKYIDEQTKSMFIEAHDAFMTKINEATSDKNGYTAVDCGAAVICYKKIKSPDKYSFVVVNDDYAETFEVNVSEFLLDISILEPYYDKEQEIKAAIAALASVALKENDLYLAYTAKECLSDITPEQADYLSSVDGHNRFISQDKIYGTNDIEVVEVQHGGNSFFNRRVNFRCAVIIAGKQYMAMWYPSDKKYETNLTHARGIQNLLVVYSYAFKRPITISDGVIKAITDKIN